LSADGTHQIWQLNYIQRTVHENVQLSFNPSKRHLAAVMGSVFSQVNKFMFYSTIFFYLWANCSFDLEGTILFFSFD
jgi:hypothetical protein